MALKTTGFTDGKSNALGMGGQSQQLKNAGVPGGVIGNLARKAGTAPGMKNFHGGKKNKAKKPTFYGKGARDTSDNEAAEPPKGQMSKKQAAVETAEGE